jgi:phosphoribosylanthranilate isomerase
MTGLTNGAKSGVTSGVTSDVTSGVTSDATGLSNNPTLAVAIKICGITRVEDALAAIDLGVAMLGVNFYPASPRCITLQQAQQIASAVAGRAKLVGVFVNMPVPDVLRIAREVPLNAVQLHGDESSDDCWVVAAEFPVICALKVDSSLEWRVFEQFRPRIISQGSDALKMEDARWDLLLDTPCTDLGGSGESFQWTDVRWDWLRLRLPHSKLFLAGGLDPGNVAQAIAIAHPSAVDVCSGVEEAKGIKSIEKMRAFVAAVRAAERQEQ